MSTRLPALGLLLLLLCPAQVSGFQSPGRAGGRAGPCGDSGDPGRRRGEVGLRVQPRRSPSAVSVYPHAALWSGRGDSGGRYLASFELIPTVVT